MESPDDDDAVTEEQNISDSGTTQTNRMELSSSTRIMRNLAEKMRRDKLNKHISQLATIVPIVSTATKRVDKTSILRLSAAYLRINQNSLNEKSEMQWRPYFLQDEQLSSLLLDALNGFLFILSTTGKVIYVSDEIEKTLGHSPVDIIGHSVYNILHPDDYPLVQRNLQITPDNINERRSFYCHLSERTLSRSDCGKYDLVNVVGHVRLTDNRNENGPNIKENLLICVVRKVRTQSITEISWMDGYQNEYITQHGLDSRIICADHRISLLTGHLPEEVRGKSAYDYIFAKDIPTATLAHRDMFLCESGLGTAVYRLWTRSKKLVYLKSQGRLQQKYLTKETDSFLCINKLLTEEEGRLELHKLRMRFRPVYNQDAITEQACVLSESAETANEEDPQVPDSDTSLKSLISFLRSPVAAQRHLSYSGDINKSPEPNQGNGITNGCRRSSSLSESSVSVMDETDHWSISSPDTMSVTSTVTTMCESQKWEYNIKNGSGQSGCTLTATARIVTGETSKTNPCQRTPTTESSEVSVPPVTAAAAINRMRRLTRNVVRLPSYHTPSPGDVQMLLEHGTQTQTNVPLKRRYPKVTSSEPMQAPVKRGRGRPRKDRTRVEPA